MATTLSYAFVNIEPQVIGEKEQGFDGEISLGAKYSTGNSENQSVGLSVKGQYDASEWLSFVIASYSYGEAKGDKNTNNALLHWRYIHSIDETLYDWEIFLQSEFNEFQDLKDRDLAGGGIRRKFDGYFDKLYIGLGLFYSYMEPRDITTEDRILKRVKINSYISFKKTFSKNFFVTYLGYYQPNVEDFSDFSSTQIMQFNTPLAESLLLSLDLHYHYNATPYQGIEKDDLRSTINIKYKF